MLLLVKLRVVHLAHSMPDAWAHCAARVAGHALPRTWSHAFWNTTKLITCLHSLAGGEAAHFVIGGAAAGS